MTATNMIDKIRQKCEEGRPVRIYEVKFLLAEIEKMQKAAELKYDIEAAGRVRKND